MIDVDSTQYTRSTPVDVLYEAMDLFINGEGIEKSKTKAATLFTAVSNDTMENLILRAVMKDASYYQVITNDNKGWIIESETKIKLGKNNEEVLEYFKNPLNEEVTDKIRSQMEGYWNL